MGIFSHAKMLMKIPIRNPASVFMLEVVECTFVGYIPSIHFPFYPFLNNFEFPNCAIWAGLTPSLKLSDTGGDP